MFKIKRTLYPLLLLAIAFFLASSSTAAPMFPSNKPAQRSAEADMDNNEPKQVNTAPPPPWAINRPNPPGMMSSRRVAPPKEIEESEEKPSKQEEKGSSNLRDSLTKIQDFWKGFTKSLTKAEGVKSGDLKKALDEARATSAIVEELIENQGATGVTKEKAGKRLMASLNNQMESTQKLVSGIISSIKKKSAEIASAMTNSLSKYVNILKGIFSGQNYLGSVALAGKTIADKKNADKFKMGGETKEATTGQSDQSKKETPEEE